MLSELGRGPRDGTQLYQGRAGVVLETGLTAMTAGGSTALRVTSPAAVRAMTISGAGTIAAAGASTQRVTTPPGFVPVGVTSPVVQVPVAGRSAIATIKASLVNMRDGRFISEHDFLIASRIAEVVCGGDVEAGSLVDEEWLLKLERRAFVDLLGTQKTQERIMGMLQTGKPVRN